MNRTASFWVSIVVFQIVFGLAVFAATRHHYLDKPPAAKADSARVRPALPAWQDTAPGTGSGQFGAPAAIVSMVSDPAELQRMANEFFANKQYEQAASAYERLLVLDPDNVNTYNNLGITLFYLGRSDEALGRLDEGTAVDPSYQRIWLTLGFVNSRLGNIGEARAALTTAVRMGADNEIGQSAMNMLDGLPQDTN